MKQKLKIKFVNGKPVLDTSNKDNQEIRCKFGIKCSHCRLKPYTFSMPQIVMDAQKIFDAEIGNPFCDLNHFFIDDMIDQKIDCPAKMWQHKHFAGLKANT